MWRGMEFHIWGAATRKARAPNERLCRGTESKWLADERVDLEGLWYCMSSVRYSGWPLLRILWTKQASLNRIRHSMRSQWSCLRCSVYVSGETEDCCITTLASACCTHVSVVIYYSHSSNVPFQIHYHSPRASHCLTACDPYASVKHEQHIPSVLWQCWLASALRRSHWVS